MEAWSGGGGGGVFVFVFVGDFEGVGGVGAHVPVGEEDAVFVVAAHAAGVGFDGEVDDGGRVGAFGDQVACEDEVVACGGVLAVIEEGH